MIKVTSTPSSVTVRNAKTQTSITVRIADKMTEFYQSLNDKDSKDAMKVQNALKDIVKNKIDKKLGYAQRFSKVSKLIAGFEGADSFKKVLNQLQKVDSI